jgi:hypothetical protein
MENEDENTVVGSALKYLELGFSVMPLGPITKDADGKKNIDYLGGWKQYQEKMATPEEVSMWKCKNLGIVTGKISNLLVLDLDSYKENYDKELVKSFCIPITPFQETASGGRQYFFKMPSGVLIKNSVCLGSKDSGIDIRGEGGMVIVDPSRTPYGSYSWVVSPDDEPLADVPPVLLDLLTKLTEGEDKVRTKLPDLVGLKEGEGRNSAMASFVGKLLSSTTLDKWDAEVWPTAQSVNETYNPPMAHNELLSIYSSISGIERNKRHDYGAGKETEEPLLYVPAMSHAELITMEFPQARYTIEPFFEQGTMNMVSAPPNTWKSWLLFQFAYNIASGTQVLGKFSTEKAGVMIVNEEDSARLVQDRLRLLDITESNLPIYYRIAQGAKLKEDFIKSLIVEAKEKDVGVIMFDSLRAIHSADENDSTAMQEVLDLLKQISRENITVIFTHHHRKKAQFGGKNNDAESTRGSSGINAAISGHISLEEKDNKSDDSKYIIVRHLKSKVGEKLDPFDVGIETGENTVRFHYLGDHEEQNQAENEAKDKIIAALGGRDELLSRKDFLHMRIAGQTTIKKATIILVAEGKIQAVKRKEAEQLGLRSLTEGKANEILYSLKLEEAQVAVMPDVEMAIPLDDDW